MAVGEAAHLTARYLGHVTNSLGSTTVLGARVKSSGIKHASRACEGT